MLQLMNGKGAEVRCCNYRMYTALACAVPDSLAVCKCDRELLSVLVCMMALREHASHVGKPLRQHCIDCCLPSPDC